MGSFLQDEGRRVVQILEVGSLLTLLGCAGAKWYFTTYVDATAREIEQGRKSFREGRENLRAAIARRQSIRQELAKTRKQVTIRIQDVKILTNQIESEEAIRQGEMEQFEKLKSAVEPNEAYATPDSRAIFG